MQSKVNYKACIVKTVLRIFQLVQKRQLAALDWSQHDLYGDPTVSEVPPTTPVPQLSHLLSTAPPISVHYVQQTDQPPEDLLSKFPSPASIPSILFSIRNPDTVCVFEVTTKNSRLILKKTGGVLNIGKE